MSILSEFASLLGSLLRFVRVTAPFERGRLWSSVELFPPSFGLLLAGMKGLGLVVVVVGGGGAESENDSSDQRRATKVAVPPFMRRARDDKPSILATICLA